MEMTLGKRIAAERKRLGITQDKLAEQLGVTAQAVSKWENDLSCPDVTMLPRLAEIFGTTTDALLGMETVHEAQVVQPGEEDEDKGFHYQDDHWDIRFDSGRRGALGFALWVLVFGGLLLASNLLHWDIGWWSICWQSGLLVLGLTEMVHKFTFMNLGMAFFGGYFLLGNFLPISLNKGVMMPVVIVLFGLSLLADALRKPKKSQFTVHNGSRKMNQSDYNVDGERFSCSTSFGEDTRRIDLPRLSGGDASVSFGQLTVDLTECGEFAPGASLDLDCAFGNLIVRIPRTCKAEHRADTSFASVTFKGRPADETTGTIFLDCNVSFGEIEIVYV